MKITQLHTEKLTNTAIAQRLHISISTAQRKLEQFTFTEDFSKLPEVLSWDKFSYQKGKLAFIAQDFNTKKIITILDNRRQTTIRNYFFKYSKEARNRVKVVTVDMSGSYIPHFEHSKREDELRLLSCLAISHPLQLTMSRKTKNDCLRQYKTVLILS